MTDPDPDPTGAAIVGDNPPVAVHRPAPQAEPTDGAYGGVTVLFGQDVGRYPDGNALLIEGSDQRILVDPSLSVHERGGVPGGRVDQILVSHAHEDHVAALHLYPEVPVWVHEADAVGIHGGVDGLLEIYGLGEEASEQWRPELIERFHVVARPDAATFSDGKCFELGGGRTATVVHLPGHTLGHSGLLVEPDGFFYVADVDLSAFGPYYGDAWSDLESFERSIARCREIDARWYATFHHKGVVEGRDAFLSQLETFAAVIGRREETLLGYLAEPRSLDDIVEHRLVYRPNVESSWVPAVERRTALLHLARLVPGGRVAEVEPGRYRAVA